ncbi:hypothetical protein REPUB_Repub13aG0073900 [Reevesia pubescens]
MVSNHCFWCKRLKKKRETELKQKNLDKRLEKLRKSFRPNWGDGDQNPKPEFLKTQTFFWTRNEGSTSSGFVSEEVDQSLVNFRALKRKACWCGDDNEDEDVTSKEFDRGIEKLGVKGGENEGQNKKRKRDEEMKKKNGNEEERNLQREKRKDSQVNGDIARKIYIEGIPSRYTKDRIRHFFESCGIITEVHCMKFPTGKFNGNAVVTFEGWIEDFSFSIRQNVRGFATERMARAANGRTNCSQEAYYNTLNL